MTIRPYRPIRSRVGRSRIPNTGDSQGAFEASVTRQMKAIEENFIGFVEHLEGQGVEIIKEALQPSFDQSQELVPELTGDLKRSGYLEGRTFRGRQVVEIGYSRGGHPHYGPFVHENLEVHHEPPTQAKFLEQPLQENSGQIQDSIIRGYKVASGV